MATFVQATDNSFDAEVLKYDIPVLVDFWADWCAPCQVIDKHLEKIANSYEDQLKIVKLDVEANPSVVDNYTILNIPTLILFKYGQEVERMVGTVTLETVLEKIRPHLDA